MPHLSACIFAHFHVRTCNFALFHFGLSWLTQLAWLAPAEYAKVQSCSFAFLHFCSFSWENWHSWQCKTAKMLEHARTQTLHFSTFSGTAGMGKARTWWLAQAEYAKVQKCIFALSAGMAGMGKKDSVVSTKGICKSTKVQFLHFCTFGCYGWHCETDDMQMVPTKTYILHLAVAVGMGKGWGKVAHRSLNTRAVACDTEELSKASLTGTSRM